MASGRVCWWHRIHGWIGHVGVLETLGADEATVAVAAGQYCPFANNRVITTVRGREANAKARTEADDVRLAQLNKRHANLEPGFPIGMVTAGPVAGVGGGLSGAVIGAIVAGIGGAAVIGGIIGFGGDSSPSSPRR